MNIKRDASLGQVWTPDNIAKKMAVYLSDKLFNGAKILDPACGPGTFIKALSSVSTKTFEIDNYDVDSRFIKYLDLGLPDIEISHTNYCRDYLTEELDIKYDAVILNPPYIRHEGIEEKSKYKSFLKSKLGVSINSRSNLLVYFLFKAIVDVKPGGYISAIVYDAIEDTLYGKEALEFITSHVDIIDCTNLNAPFDGAIVDAKVYLMKKIKDKREPIQQDIDITTSQMVPLNSLIESTRGTSFLKRCYFFRREI